MDHGMVKGSIESAQAGGIRTVDLDHRQLFVPFVIGFGQYKVEIVVGNLGAKVGQGVFFAYRRNPHFHQHLLFVGSGKGENCLHDIGAVTIGN